MRSLGGSCGAKCGRKWTRKPQLGDLVLAKVKGYPPWPAKVNKPEDWGRTPTPGRFFVWFYGTKEIDNPFPLDALFLVAMQDLQEFTEKVKNELLGQAPSIKVPKTHAQRFNKAVEQICEAYDELPKSLESASGALPDPSGKPSEDSAHLVKSPDDSETLGMGQMEVGNSINKWTGGDRSVTSSSPSRGASGRGSRSLVISSSPRSRVTHPGQPRSASPRTGAERLLQAGSLSGSTAPKRYLQEFTENVKNELLDRAPNIKVPKTHAPWFDKAVEQICNADDELPKSLESASGALPDLSGKPSEVGETEVDNPINKWTRGPQLGDLVLAKVKGYPPWPAKVSKPEDWGQTPTPCKFFVCFYGTKETGFVTLADLQEFTEKAKKELLDRAPSIPKMHAPWFKAVEQICMAYDVLQNHRKVKRHFA